MQIQVNGSDVQVDVPADTPLLYVLRNDLRLNGAKFGCGLGQCGACTVVVGNEAVRSCTTPISLVVGKPVTTLEGLTENGKPGKLQRAFIAEQAAQCGYCTAGIIMSAHAFLQRDKSPSDSSIRTALDGNLCRCGTHNRVVRAVMRAAKET